MESNAKSFSTDGGYCHVYADRIEIRDRGIIGMLERFLFARGVRRKSFLYLLLVPVFIIASIISLIIQNYLLLTFFVIMTAFSIWVAWTRRRFSLSPLIFRKDILEFEFKESEPGVSRAALQILYAVNDKAALRRVVKLPGRELLVDTARQILRDEGLV